MKTKISKRLLSVLLAALMVVTSVPLVAFADAQTEAEDAALGAVTTAMSNFQNEILADIKNNGTIYKGISTAYDAYVAAQKAVDAYYYGGETDALGTAAADLINAQGALTKWTAATFDAVAYHSGTNSSGETVNSVANGGYSNVVYSSKTTNFTSSVTLKGVKSKIALPNVIVLAYDGTNDVYGPIVYETVISGTTSFGTKYYIDFVGSQDATFGFTQNWAGFQAGNYWLWPADNIEQADSFGYALADGTEYNLKSSAQVNTGTPRFWWNRLTYLGSGNTADYYDKVSNITFKLHNFQNSSGGNDTTTATHTNYVINYEPVAKNTQTLTAMLRTALTDNGTAAYKEGGLSAIFNAIDLFTPDSLNPNSYTYSDDTAEANVTACAAAIKNAVSSYTEPGTPAKDSAEYAALRTAMDNRRTQYNNGVNTGYTEISYGELQDAYVYARDNIMAFVNDNGYVNTTDAQNYADILNGITLEYPEKVDVSELTALINSFEKAENIFTTDSYNNAVAVIAAAKAAVWTDESLYGNDASLPNIEDTEGVNTVNTQTGLVRDAIAALRVDPDVIVDTSNGRHSLNEAIALKDSINKADYNDSYDAFQKAIENAEAYLRNIDTNFDTTNGGDYATLYSNYVALVNAVYEAFGGLNYNFLSLPDGAIAKEGSTTAITTLSYDDSGTQYIDFSYPSGTYVFKTTHNEATVKYGDVQIAFGVDIKDGSSTNLANNMLDSISINATAEPLSEYWINGYKSWSSAPEGAGVTTDQKLTYAPCLSYEGFSLQNLSYAGYSSNNDARAEGRLITLSDGTEIKDYGVATSTDVTDILGTLDGTETDPGRGGIFARSSDGNRADAYVNGDMCYTLPATDTTGENGELLTSNTLPSTTSYKLQNTYFGAVTLRNVQATSAVSGYNWYTTKSNNETLNSTVNVIDISYLKDLVNACAKEMDKSDMYTASSWSTFTTAYNNAVADLDYSSLTAATILSNCKSRYTSLYDAWKSLVVKSFNVTFSYKDENGADASSVIKVKYGETLSDYSADVENIKSLPATTYVSGAYTYTYTKNWDPAIDLTAAVNADITYTAVYDEALNKADFEKYDAAVAKFLGALSDNTYLTSELTALNDKLSAMTYYYMSDADRDTLMGDSQEFINAEQAQIEALINDLNAVDYTTETAEAAIEVQMASRDEDVYNVSAEFSYNESVRVGGDTETKGKTVIGLTYTSIDDLDAAIRNYLNSLEKCVYTVYVNEVAVGTAEYGTPVIVNSNNEFFANVADTDSNEHDGTESVAWSYCYSAPSRNNTRSTAKYVFTNKSIGFVVKGDTYLSTVKATSDESGYVVKFMTNDGKIFDIEYVTNGSVTVPAAPNYPFYNFTGYNDGYTVGATIPITGDTTVIANYAADTSNTYSINYYATQQDWFNLNASVSDSYQYNDVVSLSKSDAYCWVSAYYDGDSTDEYTLLAYGTEYSFRACQTVDIVSFTESEYESVVSDGQYEILYDGNGNVITKVQGEQKWDGTYDLVMPAPVATVSAIESVVPIYNSENKLASFAMIGTFTLPEGYDIVEAGILFTSDQSADLNIEKVDTAGGTGTGIARYKATSYSCGNQFIISVKAPSSGNAVSFKYAAYAIARDASGNLVTLYSKSVMGTTQGL